MNVLTAKIYTYKNIGSLDLDNNISAHKSQQKKGTNYNYKFV